jgi:hypothetical protein
MGQKPISSAGEVNNGDRLKPFVMLQRSTAPCTASAGKFVIHA